MGQKVNPISFRLGYIKSWSSLWYADKKDFSAFLHEDIKLKKYVLEQLASAGVARVEVERASDKVRINILSSRPGIIIGRRGAEIDRLKEELQSIVEKEVHIDINEIKNPNTNALLVAKNIAFQLEKRVAFRRAMKKAIQNAMSSGAKGVKITCSGRLGGAEIARSETYKEGKIPLHTLRADIDYGFFEAKTTYGLIGIKVWIYKGDVLKKSKKQEIKNKKEK